jgi:tRNA(fMet)-specific endonuclease VapC
MILLDTDICIELLKGNKHIIQRRNQTDSIIGISFMSVAELYYGAEKSTNPSKNLTIIEELLLSLEILQTDIPILKRFGILKSNLQKNGISLPDADILIASTALAKCEKLITGNTKHFKRIPDLAIEDWK